jgi:thioester reductase-like protein
MSDTILLTGGTGFLGMSLIARLLEDDEGPEILLAVRAADGEMAAGRIDELLGRLYDEPPASACRLRAIPAELTEAGLGLTADDRREVVATVDRVIHCAASVSFTLPLDDARAINVGGTRAVLDLARQLPNIQRFVHVSTAYVAGCSQGSFAESDLDRGQTYRNTYERTKAEAERLVMAATDLPIVVVRPSIVVGESDSGWTSAFNVIYWPLQAFSRGLLDEVPADPEGLVDIVPVDHVIEVLCHAAFTPGLTGTLHAVSGEHALRVRELADRASALLDCKPPRLVAPGTFCPSDPGCVFAPYYDVQVSFDDRRARAQGLSPPTASADFLPAIMQYAKTAGWGRWPLTRQRARQLAFSTR